MRSTFLTMFGLCGATLLMFSAAAAQNSNDAAGDSPGTVNIAPFPTSTAPQESTLPGWSGTGWNVIHFEVITGQLDAESDLRPEMVTATDRAGLTPLHYAAAMGNETAVEWLLDAGASPHASAFGGFSVIHAACQFGNLEMVQKLLDLGADPTTLFRGDWQWLSEGVLADEADMLRNGMQSMLESPDWDAGISSMHLAAQSGNDALVRLLLASGVDPGRQTLLNGIAPLHLCTSVHECTKLLLDAGAEPDPVEELSGQTPLLGSSYENAALLLAAGADPDVLNSWGYGRLHTVESATMAALLLDNGADINLRGAYGETPLMSAADRGIEGLVRQLVDRGAGLNEADYMARTALDRAVDSGNQAISSMLAEAGALGGYEMHPLHYTCALADNAVISLAIEAGEDVNATDICGWSALHYAAMSGSADTVTLLLSAGSDVNATDSQGATALTRSPLHVTEIVSALLEAGADPNAFDPWFGNSLIRAVSSGNEDAAVLLLDAGADPHSTGPSGRNALMYAAQGGNALLIRKLLDVGADTEAMDDDGMTALMHALAYSSFYGDACARLLLDAGADVNATDNLGRTMLHHLALRGGTPLAAILVEKGCPHNLPDNRGYTAARLARLAGNENLAGWLETI